MLEENDIQDDEVQHEEGQGQEPADQNPPPIELPDDPVELRRVAEQQAADLREKQAKLRTLKQENERLGTNYQEQKAKADYAVSKNARLEAELLNQGAKPAAIGSGAGKSAPQSGIKEAVKGLDLAEYVADQENGVANLVAELENRGVILTPAGARRMIEDEKRAASEETRSFQELGKRVPDLAKGDTPLAEKTYEMLGSVAEEFPNVPRAAQMEIAASRARIALEKNPPKKDPQQRNGGGNRLTGAQGGPVTTGRSGGGGGVHVELTDADRRQWAKMSGGVPIKDSDLLAAKREAVEAQNRRQQPR